MSALKLTKNELRNQQMRLTQLRRYLPTLQLKKSLLQYEVSNVLSEIISLKQDFIQIKWKVESFSAFFVEKVSVNLNNFAVIQHVKKRYENIAGIEIPILETVQFQEIVYFMCDTPVWTESAVELLRSMIVAREKINVALEKKRALEKELREVSIRVNLFEKILIPRSMQNIKKIRIFLGDQQLAAVAQAKVAKSKIIARRGQQ
ncbi:MAG: atpD [Parachlamydiales bacterium]|nr:atpD [Parachlamydiales bacterium]